jgi:hypothetical protein
MKRWVWFFLCALLGLAMLSCGLLMPIYLRAVDTAVLAQAGKSSPGLIDRGIDLVNDKQLGAAQLLLQASRQQRVLGREKLDDAVSSFARHNPRLAFFGAPTPKFESLFERGLKSGTSNPEPFTDFIVREENRQRALKLLAVSGYPLVQEVMRGRSLTNTVIFPPSYSTSGQAIDAALALCGLLGEEKRFTGGLSNALFQLASEAPRNPQPFEQVLLDLLSLGQRFSWGQLAAFVEKVEDAETLRLLANVVRKADGQLPELFSAIQLSGRAAPVARYAMTFSKSGLKDLGASLKYGAGGVSELLKRKQLLHNSRFRWSIGLEYCLHTPWFALILKWLLYLAGGFLLAVGVHCARRPVSVMEQPLQVRGFHFAREFLFALGFLLVVLLFSEPFLAQESQKVEFPFRLRLPVAGSAAPAVGPRIDKSLMNNLSLLTLLLFFVIQALIYASCVVKLAEIRRQHLSARMKLRLLDNEDHLFDAGLYLGFVGTIISLILVSLGVIKPSLMAAYSSTSFGIIFVSCFKIFNLRPVRRRLIMEAEAAGPQTVAPGAARAYATPS